MNMCSSVTERNIRRNEAKGDRVIANMLKELRITAWPVGQGLFSQAELMLDWSVFRIIYDCGAEQRRNAQIFTGSTIPDFTTAVSTPESSPLDLLVISHFHYDHISAIDALLKRSNGAKRAWIPYVSPKMRILFAIATAAHACSERMLAKDYRNVVMFLANPKAWLHSHGVQIVEEIGTPEDNDEGEYPPDLPPDKPEDGEKLSDPDQPTDIHLSNIHRWPGAFRYGNGRVITPVAKWAQASAGAVKQVPLVLLVTWIKPQPEDIVERLRTEISQLLSQDTNSLVENMLNTSTSIELDSHALWRLVQEIVHKHGRVKLRRLYRSLDHDLNSTSLFLLAQVISNNTQTAYPVAHQYLGPWGSRLIDEWSWCAPRISYNKCPAMLWCGDAPATVLQEVLNCAEDDLRNRLSHTVIWQVSHHGSAASFNRDFFDAAAKPVSFVSYGLENRYGHPSEDVVQATGCRKVSEETSPFRASIQWW